MRAGRKAGESVGKKEQILRACTLFHSERWIDVLGQLEFWENQQNGSSPVATKSAQALMKANKVLCQTFSSGKHRSEYIHALSSLTPFTLPNTPSIPSIAKVGVWVNISELLFHLGHISSSFDVLCHVYRDLEKSVQVHPVLVGYVCCRLVMLYISIPRSFLFPESLQMLEDINCSFSKVIVELQTIKTSFSQMYVVVITLYQYLSQWCIAIWKKNVTQANQLLAHYHSMYQRSLASLSGSVVSHTISSEEDLSLASLLGKCSLKELNGSSEVLCDVRVDCGHFLFLYKLCACSPWNLGQRTLEEDLELVEKFGQDSTLELYAMRYCAVILTMQKRYHRAFLYQERLLRRIVNESSLWLSWRLPGLLYNIAVSTLHVEQPETAYIFFLAVLRTSSLSRHNILLLLRLSECCVLKYRQLQKEEAGRTSFNGARLYRHSNGSTLYMRNDFSTILVERLGLKARAALQDLAVRTGSEVVLQDVGAVLPNLWLDFSLSTASLALSIALASSNLSGGAQSMFVLFFVISHELSPLDTITPSWEKINLALIGNAIYVSLELQDPRKALGYARSLLRTHPTLPDLVLRTLYENQMFDEVNALSGGGNDSLSYNDRISLSLCNGEWNREEIETAIRKNASLPISTAWLVQMASKSSWP
eukprot:gene9741-10775_t